MACRFPDASAMMDAALFEKENSGFPKKQRCPGPV
jgi:hypothetical protein